MTTLLFWNLYEAGLEAAKGDDRRWQEQVAVVRRHAPDVLCITEGWRWDANDRELFERAKRDFGYQHGELYEAKTGCHMAIFWNEPIELIDFHGTPQVQAWWHGGYRATLRIPGQAEPFVVVGTHLNPFDPTLRRIEGSFLRVMLPARRHGVIVMDANAVPPGDPEPAFDIGTHQLDSEVADRGAVEVLAAAGLIDVGAHRGDRTPTTGHVFTPGGAAGRPIRLDQVWMTPSVQLSGYGVVTDTVAHPELDHASDHRPVWIELAGTEADR